MDNFVNLDEYYSKYYIIDFLNIFSDYREILYKKKDIDFHSVKHNNKEKDTLGFFQLFFTKYIEKVNIDKCSVFIFILKRINNYDNILSNILNIYQQFKIKFILIEDEYENKLIDKNKDDFMCQYIFFLLFKNFKNCILISNDKYRDKLDYIKLFDFNITENILKITRRDKGEGWEENLSCDISISSKERIYLFKENNSLDNNYINAFVTHNGVKIFNSRDINYVKHKNKK